MERAARATAKLKAKARSRSTSDDLEPLQQAVEYFTAAKERTPSNGNLHLEAIEGIAFEKGLLPDVIELLLDVAMSARLVDRFNTRLLKCLIPASTVPESAVTNAISWMCTRKPTINVQLIWFPSWAHHNYHSVQLWTRFGHPDLYAEDEHSILQMDLEYFCKRVGRSSTEVLFIRWLLTVFDLLDSKKQLNSLYGIIFFYIQNVKLCPYICHLLYLLTKKENVKRFRVKKLIDLQSKTGMQPHLVALLLLYKIHAPEYVSLTLPGKPKSFQVSGSFWKKVIEKVQNNGYRQLTGTLELVNLTELPTRKRKRKMHRELIPVVSTTPHLAELSCSLMQSTTFPLEQLTTFSQLLQNFDRIEFPAQMGSVLRSPLLLHYINWVKDDSALLRLDFWLAQTLQEEFADCNGDSLQKEKEFVEFLNIIIRTQEFLQEGFSCCEDFVLKSLSFCDSLWCSTQILALLTRISPSSDVISLYFDPLMKLFFTSSIYFKCTVIESLTNLLVKWLTWHSVCVAEMDRDITNVLQSPQNVSLSGLVNSISELVEFTTRISMVALQMEAYNSLLLHFILNFYETVSDMYLKYSLPLVILPPAGIFYPALLSLESINLNQLCYVMYKYRTNLTALKSLDSSKNVHIGLRVNRKAFQQYNTLMKAAVSCLWTSRNFEQDIPPMGIGIEHNLLVQTRVPDFVSSFTIVNHPALMGHAINFIQKQWPSGKKQLHAIQGNAWNWYVEYLYDQELDGLKHFLESCLHTASSSEH